MDNSKIPGIARLYRTLKAHFIFFPRLKGCLLFLLFCSLAAPELSAQTPIIDEVQAVSTDFDQIPVQVIVTGFGNFDVDAIYTQKKQLCVNIGDLFKTLHIPCLVGEDGNSLSGFLENESHTYSINYETKQIKVGTRIIEAKSGLVKEMGSLYLDATLFDDAFGIALTFNYRSLSMILKSDFELPALKLQRIEKMRTNMSKVTGEVVADTVLQRNYHLFRFGTLDWSVSSSQSWKMAGYNQIGIGIGTELLFGEVDISLNLYDQQKFDYRQLNYLWRWVDNTKKLIKQAQVGRLSNQTIASIYAPVVGAVIRNSPTTVRKAKGYYTINEVTEPNWTVELYINNVMVDYTTADGSGLYVFKVPIVYGYTTLKLKFYGPLGEERTEERTMNVPYTVMSANEFEYGLSAGIVQDSTQSRYAKGEFNYGVNRLLTVGGGVEYLSSILDAPYIPFARITMQPFSRLTINAEYAHGVKTRGLFNYYFKKDILLEVDYTKYVEGQQATTFNALEERKVKLSFPLKIKKLSGYAKLDYSQMVYKSLSYNQAGMILSTYYKQMSANSSTQFSWTDPKTAYVATNLSLSYRLNKGYTIRPSAQYNVSAGYFMSYDLALEKNIPRGNIAISYKGNALSNDNYINLIFKYDLRFARTNFSVSQSRGQVFTSESAKGSLAFGSGKGNVHGSNNSSVGKGGISIYPFLDLNQNGLFDKNEKLVKLSTVKTFGGNAVFSEKDSIIRISDLNAFTSYRLEFNDNELNNIAWRFKKHIYQVLIDPNQYKRIEIPVISVGEVSGLVSLKTDSTLKGIGRILVKFYKKGSNDVVAETLTESDGYIYYLGLGPGEYVARIDPEQLRVLSMVSMPEQIPVSITASIDGDIVDGLDFTIQKGSEIKPDSLNSVDALVKAVPKIVVIAQAISEHPAKDEKQLNSPTKNRLQVGAFNQKSNALSLLNKLVKVTDKPCTIVFEKGFYKVRVLGFDSQKQAMNYATLLKKYGFQVSYIPVNY